MNPDYGRSPRKDFEVRLLLAWDGKPENASEMTFRIRAVSEQAARNHVLFLLNLHDAERVITWDVKVVVSESGGPTCD